LSAILFRDIARFFGIIILGWNIEMKKTYWLDPKDKLGLLVNIMKFLAGDARIALEGELQKFDFSSIPNHIDTETESIKHETGIPHDPIIILPLEPDTIKSLLDQLLPKGKCIYEITAILIEKNGKIEFMAGDNFHRECVSVGELVSTEFLNELVSKGILRSYKKAQPAHALDSQG